MFLKFFLIFCIVVAIISFIGLLKIDYENHKNKKKPYRIVENGLGDYILQKYQYGDWSDIEQSADLEELNELYNNCILKLQKERDNEEYSKLSHKIVKIIKQ